MATMTGSAHSDQIMVRGLINPISVLHLFRWDIFTVVSIVLSEKAFDSNRESRMEHPLTKRHRVVLAVLAADPGAVLAPVQVQKLFFLVDQKTADEFDGPLFSFKAYDYGPFDKAVYQDLDFLESIGLVTIENKGTKGERRYSLTFEGQDIGRQELSDMRPNIAEYVAELSKWVSSLSFAELVGAIYKEYPEMRANSIFDD